MELFRKQIHIVHLFCVWFQTLKVYIKLTLQSTQMKLRDYNFDQAVLQDSLFQALKRSQQTRHLVTLRAQEIVTEITKDAWMAQLKQKLENQRSKLSLEQEKNLRLETSLKKIKQKEEKRKKSLFSELRTEKQKIINEYNKQLQSRISQGQAMQQQIQILSNQIVALKQQNQSLLIQLENKQNQIQSISNQTEKKQQTIKLLESKLSSVQVQFEKLFKNHQQQMEKNFSKNKIYIKQIQHLRSQISTLNKNVADFQQNKKANFQNQIQKDSAQKNIHQQKISSLRKEINKINNQKQRLKKQLMQSEENYGLVKKQIGKFKQKYKVFQQEFHQTKIDHIQTINQKDFQLEKQDKMIKKLQEKLKNLEIQQQTVKRKKTQNLIKIKGFFKNYLFTLNMLKQQNSALKSYISQKTNLLREFSQSAIMKIINHISTQLNQHFQQCILEIRKAREQKYLAKQEAKFKNEIIQHLDKLLNNEAKSVYDLRSELRLKKKQQQKLRKKLKSHYQQTDKKLQNFQKKYISILKQQY